MDAAVIRQFLDYFQDFLHLCQFENWPNNDTTERELKNAFLVSQHVEKCMDRLQKNDIMNEFLSTLQNNDEIKNVYLKTCLGDPPKYILKKIIKSNTKIHQMDIGVKLFLELFSEQRLEDSLTDIMWESASKEALLRNLQQEIPKDKIIEFKSHILLSELHKCDNEKKIVSDMLREPSQDIIDLLILSVINKDINHINSVNCIITALKDVMSCKNNSNQLFWKFLFQTDKEHFNQFCLKNADLFNLIVNSLIDCSKLLRENMSSELFYINVTYSQLVTIVKRICASDNLRIEFLDIVGNDSGSVDFWQNMLL
ncbi:uncharacterized protein ACR2FA_009700 [Aphomia sociella]